MAFAIHRPVIRDSRDEDLSLKMVRVGDALLRSGRVAEAAAVYRRAARAFEKESRLSHARASWRLVLKASPGDEEACHHIVYLGGLPTAPEKRSGYSTRVQVLTAEEAEGTAVGEELAELTDAGFRDVEPSMHTEIYHQPVSAEPSVTVERQSEHLVEPTIPGAPPQQKQPAVGLIRPLPSRLKQRKPETTRISAQAAVYFEDPEFTATSPEHSLT